jgi:aryl-alcohol dehydrogenase-like predicted oxidoreductase
VQAPFNLVDRRLHSTGWLQRLKNSGVELHTRSTFLQGLLLMSQNEMPAKFAPWRELWNKWFRWLEHSCYSPVEACLAFPLSFPEIDRVVVGADSHEQLAQVIKAANYHSITMLPDLQCTDEDLINPGNWSKL